MSLTSENMGPADLAAVIDGNRGGYPYPVYQNGGNNGFGFGGDASWLLILFLFAMMGGWGGMGGFGGFGGMGGGWGLYPWLNQSNQISDGFQNQALGSNIQGIQNSITSGFGDVQTALCGGFAGVNASINGAQNALSQQLYTNQLAELERSFAAQTATTQGMNALQAALAQCCCDNRLATAGLSADLAREACATRTADTQNTQAILNVVNGGIQSIKDQLCQDKIDAKNDEIAQLRQELLYSRGQASQDVQTARLLAGQTAEIDALYNRLSQCPVPSTPVFGRTPIFTCASNVSGCGCGNNTGFVA